MRKLLVTAFTFVFAHQFVVAAYGDFYDYTFVGEVPTGASTHSMVADGETWTASFRIDTSTSDENPSNNVGFYPGAVVFGSLEFSGGYVANMTDFGGANLFVLNDTFEADSIRVRGEFQLDDFVFQANSEDLTTLGSDLLVEPGFSFDPFPNPATFEYFQLLFTDEFGTVNYFANQANNVSFSASAIPEPMALPILVAFAAMAVRRKR